MGPALHCNMPLFDQRGGEGVGNITNTNERLHLIWKGLAANLSAEVSDLGLTKLDTDVLLLPSASKGISFKAHRVVLAAASDFIKNLLLQSPNGEDPVLVLESMEGETLADLMTYLYRGQVNLPQRRLERFLAWGKSLAIKGILELEATTTVNHYLRHPPPPNHMDIPTSILPSWPSTSGNWQMTSGGGNPLPASTGLSLLASAALESDHEVVLRERRFSSGNDENNSLNGNFGPTSNLPVSAMNLSLKPSNCDSDSSMMATNKSSTSGFKPVLYPKAHLLNIPNPNSLKWKRALMTSASSTITSDTARADNIGPMDMVEGSEDEDALTIDMSANTPIQESASSVGLPATPSPSPSSMGNGNSSLGDHRVPAEMTTNGINYQLGILPSAAPINPSNDELLEHPHLKPRQNSECLSQSSSGEGKKWKSRQPKLCVHCDRYFSNQFNLKQHILNMHTVGGDVRCDKCNKTVKNKWYLRRHHVTHHNAPLKK